MAAPEDEAIVSSATVDVEGVTTPDAVASVNGEPLEVDSDGGFRATVNLDEGPNIIDIVVSDFTDERIEEIRTVIYVP